METQDYDVITSFLGDWGPFQRTVFFLLSCSIIPNGYVGLSMVFLADTPLHYCRVPTGNGSGLALNQSLIPSVAFDGTLTLSRCTRFKWKRDGQVNETEECLQGWEYSKERYISTIVTEWDLVCKEDWKVPFTTSVFFFGVLTGSFFSGQFSDRYGRKKILFVTMALQTIFSLLQVISVTWEMFCVLFFFVGLGQISNYVSAFVLGNEIFSKSTRIAYSTLGVCVFYSLGYVVLPLFAYFIRDWRMLLLAISLPGILYIPLWWFIPESPRWLLSQGRMHEAEAILRAAAIKNGVTPPEVIFNQEESLELMNRNIKKKKHLYTYFDLIRTTNIRNLTILNCLIWMMITIGYFGISLNTSNMSGDPYINCFISAVTEVVAYIAAWVILRYVPRRIALSLPLLLSGSMLLLMQFIPDEYQILSIILAMTGKFGVTVAFSVVYVYSAELFPTVVRNMGIGAASMSSRIGGIISPYFAYIGTYNKILPYILMGGITMAIGIFSLLLPETQGVTLPEKMEDVQQLHCILRTLKENLQVLEKKHTNKTLQIQQSNDPGLMSVALQLIA
ncbi:solute carrier family 22 member 4-like isoform X1 [Polypterus senegalus]|uniref:solute carrier family 22 member 4-like isoform X1 n=2 Tax=Polypterus senegalus TaxID=55291 RepID=UPI00196265CF|nr:solute carrier family 22 member 4-like isoform X1 [Polypterus senegalus]XP_039606968.1 solute carrier family 22 member 4-like isoform X1 [Polypterus senegalus]